MENGRIEPLRALPAPVGQKYLKPHRKSAPVAADSQGGGSRPGDHLKNPSLKILRRCMQRILEPRAPRGPSSPLEAPRDPPAAGP